MRLWPLLFLLSCGGPELDTRRYDIACDNTYRRCLASLGACTQEREPLDCAETEAVNCHWQWGRCKTQTADMWEKLDE